MRRPLVGVAACFVAGIALGRQFPGAAGVAVWTAALLGGVGLGCRRCQRRWISCQVVVYAITVATAVLAGRMDAQTQARRMRAFAPLRSGPVRVAGTVCGMPAWRITGRGDLHVQGVLRDVRVVSGDQRITLDRLAFFWAGPDTSPDADFGRGVVPFPGERWQIEGPLRHGPWGRARRASMGWSVSARTVRRVKRAPALSPPRLLFEARERLARRLTRGMEGDAVGGAVVRAMLLGDRGGMTAAMTEPFRRSGTLHVFAISGLHVGMLALLGLALLRFAGVPRGLWPVCLGPWIAAYVLVSGSRPSAVRAAVLLMLYLCGPGVRRRPDGLSALAAAAVLMLAWDPGALRDPGFVLSFGVVLGLMVWTAPLLRWMDGIGRGRHAVLDARARAMASRSADSTWRRFLGRWRPGLRVKQLAAVTLAAWWTSQPLMAHYFGRVAWVALPANLFMTPMAFLAVMLGSASLAAGLFSDALARGLNGINLYVIHGMLHVARVASALPAAMVRFAPLPGWIALLWAAALLGAGGWFRHRQLQHRSGSWEDASAA